VKILMTMPFPNVRGPLSKHTPWLIEGLRSLGCVVGTEPWERHSDNESFREKVFGRFRDIIRINRRLRKETFDALLLKTGHDWKTLVRDILLLFFAGSRRPVTILLFHGSRSDWLVGPGHLLFKLATRALLRLSHTILVLSQEELDEWRMFYPQVKAQRVSNPFVSQQDIPRRITSVPSDISSNAPVLLFVGRLVVEKGIFDLLDALAILQQEVTCHLLVVGDGPEKKRTLERVRQLDLQEHVTLTGYLSGGELAHAYRSSDVFVLPTFWAEGFPTVIAEAMDAGLPIVTTKLRGTADHLAEGRNALFVPARNPAALAETLRKIIMDDALRAKMSSANQTEVKKFQPEVVATEYVRIIQDTVRRGSADAKRC
jgi:glycosyltransferase involved in cell wall biosynthesis